MSRKRLSHSPMQDSDYLIDTILSEAFPSASPQGTASGDEHPKKQSPSSDDFISSLFRDDSLMHHSPPSSRLRSIGPASAPLLETSLLQDDMYEYDSTTFARMEISTEAGMRPEMRRSSYPEQVKKDNSPPNVAGLSRHSSFSFEVLFPEPSTSLFNVEQDADLALLPPSRIGPFPASSEIEGIELPSAFESRMDRRDKSLKWSAAGQGRSRRRNRHARHRDSKRSRWNPQDIYSVSTPETGARSNEPPVEERMTRSCEEFSLDFDSMLQSSDESLASPSSSTIMTPDSINSVETRTDSSSSSSNNLRPIVIQMQPVNPSFPAGRSRSNSSPPCSPQSGARGLFSGPPSAPLTQYYVIPSGTDANTSSWQPLAPSSAARRKERHRHVERVRREKLRQDIDQLRSLIQPKVSDTTSLHSKMLVLKHASDVLREMKGEVERLRHYELSLDMNIERARRHRARRQLPYRPAFTF